MLKLISVVAMDVVLTAIALGEAVPGRKSHLVTGLSIQNSFDMEPAHLLPFYDFRYPGQSAEETKASLVDEQYWGRRPTLVVVGRGEIDEERTRNFLKEFVTQRAKGSLSKIGKQIKEAFRKERQKKKMNEEPMNTMAQDPAEETSESIDKPKGSYGVQFIFLTDPRPIWERAFEQGKRTARKIAERDHPILKNGQGRLRQRAEEKFERLSKPKLDKEVPKTAAIEYHTIASQRDRELSEILSPDEYRISGLLDQRYGPKVMTALGLIEPQYRIFLVGRDGTVSQSWGESELDPNAIRDAIQKME